jgi:hypothetical protein
MGHEVPVLRANQLFRAVYAELGQHVIHFYYRQSGLLPGAIISVLTCILLGGLYFSDLQENMQHRTADTLENLKL